MVGIADGDDANAALLCLFNGERHGLVTDKLAHTVMSVDHGGDRRFKDHLRLGIDMDHAIFDALVITHHALHTVALNAIKVACEQDVLNNVGLRFGEAELFKRLHAERMKRFVFPMLIAHSVPPNSLLKIGGSLLPPIMSDYRCTLPVPSPPMSLVTSETFTRLKSPMTECFRQLAATANSSADCLSS